jgi:hypothetical protein
VSPLRWLDAVYLAFKGQNGRREDLRSLATNFGSQLHYAAIAQALAAFPSRARVRLDLLPVTRLGNTDALRPIVSERRLSFVTGDPKVTRALLDVDPRAEVLEVLKPEGDSTSALDSYCDARRSSFEPILNEVVARTAITARSRDWPEKCVKVDGRSYLVMPNGMLITHFVNMKAVFADPDFVEAIAQEVLTQACFGFAPETRTLWPDAFVASSDQAYVVVSAMQQLLNRDCGVIHRIGLLPGRALTREITSVNVRGRRVCLVVDLSATGAEIEKSVTVLVQQGARIASIVCCVWLDCAQPKFLHELRFLPLARPRLRLGFVYRSTGGGLRGSLTL